MIVSIKGSSHPWSEQIDDNAHHYKITSWPLKCNDQNCQSKVSFMN